MTQREFDRRVKGKPNAERKPVRRRVRLLDSRPTAVALFLFCAAIAIALVGHGERLISRNGAPAPAQAAIQAFGASPMRAARGVVKRSEHAAGSPLIRYSGSDAEEAFAQAWDGAIARMRMVFDPTSESSLDASLEALIDQVTAAAQSLAARADELLPSPSDTASHTLGLNSNLPMLAGAGAFAALILLCFGAAVSATGKVAHSPRPRRVHYGSRRR
ncbi:MAG: hypothetical protein ACREQR_16765 [Candidatus Binataceae bacterium]